jgi:hypothetical protein
MNKKLITCVVTLMAVMMLFTIPVLAADASIDNYQISIHALAIHNATNGKWYLLNNNKSVAGEKQTIDFTLTAASWLGSHRLIAGHYDKVAMVVGEDVKYKAHYDDGTGTIYGTDGTQTSNMNPYMFVTIGDPSSNINAPFNASNPSWDASVSVKQSMTATDGAKYANAVPTVSETANMWNPNAANMVGASELQQDISLDLSEANTGAALQVNWDTTGCIQVGTGDGSKIEITELRPPKIIFNFHN